MEIYFRCVYVVFSFDTATKFMWVSSEPPQNRQSEVLCSQQLNKLKTKISRTKQHTQNVWQTKSVISGPAQLSIWANIKPTWMKACSSHCNRSCSKRGKLKYSMPWKWNLMCVCSTMFNNIPTCALFDLIFIRWLGASDDLHLPKNHRRHNEGRSSAIINSVSFSLLDVCILCKQWNV